MTLVLLLCLGGAMGFLAGFLGTGGGTLAIPALVLLLGYDQKLAQGTVLVMVILTVVKAFTKYKSQSKLDTGLIAVLSISACMSTVIGALVVRHLPSNELQFGYGVFMVLLVIPMLLGKAGVKLATPLPLRWAALPGALGGITLGLFGVGGAMLTVPFLVLAFGQSQVRAQGAGLAVALPGCAISFIPYAATGQVVWPAAVALAVGSFATVGAGVKAAHQVDERILVGAFCCILAVTGAALIYKSALW